MKKSKKKGKCSSRKEKSKSKKSKEVKKVKSKKVSKRKKEEFRSGRLGPLDRYPIPRRHCRSRMRSGTGRAELETPGM